MHACKHNRMEIASILCCYLLYQLALPKPIPGIPYNEVSVRGLLGDLPALARHVKDGGNFASYALSTVRALNSPLVQIFVRPFGKPNVLLADFGEARDLLLHRKEFDRSRVAGDLTKGFAHDHHIKLKTGEAWKSQRRLIQDLMTPNYLHNVAGPVVYQKARMLMDLWRIKAEIAGERPFEASDDVFRGALDGVMSFCFGERFRDTAMGPAIDALHELDRGAMELKHDGNPREPVKFHVPPLNAVLESIVTISETPLQVQGSPWPGLKWAFVLRNKRIAQAVEVKERYIHDELEAIVERLRASENDAEKSAVHHMVLRERALAEKEGRAPQYFSRVMIDEVFGFIFAGHETTSTTIGWGLKLLADNPHVSSKLRTVLRASFALAWSEARQPTMQEIARAHIPYLDATLEEIQRCGGTTPIIDREAVVDTQLLGQHIPKGTNVACLVMGPSMMEPGLVGEGTRTIHTDKGTKVKPWDPSNISSFDPERWIADKNGAEVFNPAAGPQLAFGLGARACYGKRLAYLQMRIFFSLLLWNFELLPCPPVLSDYSSGLVITNKPKHCYACLREVNSFK
ncbi:cytochrome P450 monooxygenase [Lophiotrema nucula]|uniref:Cytochrome P450 monooxygenase n=1 Tax=Lophiotrema nucula TaxID=690887 RepID=A0A6A5ZLQ2_9PLEO|nr:cytochrome P450 monooxygenase [Lophiotrema nucula]